MSETPEQAIARLKQWVTDLQSGLYVNCVYCGHRYGPGETTPVSMADALKAHVETCPEHPMASLKRELDAIEAEKSDRDAHVANIAAGLREPGRMEEARRYNRAIIGALNATHTDGEQDAVAMFEAIGRAIAQLIGDMPEDVRRGVVTFVGARALKHAPDFAATGMAARLREDEAPEGRH